MRKNAKWWGAAALGAVACVSVVTAARADQKTERLDVTSQALLDTGDECLKSVRDKGTKYELTPACNALSALSMKYIEAGGALSQTPDKYELLLKLQRERPQCSTRVADRPAEAERLKVDVVGASLERQPDRVHETVFHVAASAARSESHEANPCGRLDVNDVRPRETAPQGDAQGHEVRELVRHVLNAVPEIEKRPADALELLTEPRQFLRSHAHHPGVDEVAEAMRAVDIQPGIGDGPRVLVRVLCERSRLPNRVEEGAESRVCEVSDHDREAGALDPYAVTVLKAGRGDPQERVER